ncbi:hypothetical protein KXD93_23195 [Mucilaginibacter sp. BJC16-A38]|uniref:hypothetical protein n=1 Tax=Mucilaginibacter phenanthrenivorans TaxID=1234842 RepID=UPI00215736E7|nr:hypothetical protein [Mucilaginibacter phenanthrenivorans]MCR8560580.1 hypothetical protein [Mucilaginibacter phenanthrenivorans]
MQFDIADEFFIAFLTAMQRWHVRYMLIGGIAVNFHGVSRNTHDMDIWLAPTNKNRDQFYLVLLDLGYTDEEISEYKEQDFTTFFKCSIGEMPNSIDCLTFVHPNIDFDEAEKEMIKHDIGNDLILNVVNYDFLRSMKVLTHREKDWHDVARLDELKKKK